MPRRKKSKPLGAADDFHLGAAEHRLREAYKAIAKLEEFHDLRAVVRLPFALSQTLRFRMGEADAHISSINRNYKQDRVNQAGSNLNALQAGTADLWDTLGFQCTRKKGGIR